MSAIPITSSGESTIYPDYSQASLQGKQDTKEILDQMLGVLVDFSESYARTQRVLNAPEHRNLAVQQRLGEKMQHWNNEIKNSVLNHRRALNRLLSDLKYLVGSIPKSEKLYDDLENSSKPLRDHWDSNRIGGDKLKIKRQADDVHRILELPQLGQQYTQTRPSQTTTVVRQSNVSPQPTQRVYVIDPVTGERREKIDGRPSNTTTTVYRPASPAPAPAPMPVQPAQQYYQPAPQQAAPRPAPPQPAPVLITKDYDYMSRRQDLDDKRGQEEAYARALDLFDSCRETKLEVDDHPTKIEVSNDGNRIYYGGETFGLLQYDTDGFVVPHGALFKNKISDINPVVRTSNQPADSKFQNSRLGDVLVGEFNTWNVLLYDSEMQELGRLNSKAGASNRLPTTYAQFKTTSKMADSCLWYSGTQNLSVVNTTNYINNELNNFWTMQGRQVEPIGAHLSAKGDIVGIAKFDQNQHSLHYMSVKNINTVLAYHRTDIFPYCHNWLCVDGSDRGDVFFIGGSSTMEQRGGTGYILALSLDENCDVIRWKEFPPSTGVFGVQVLKTYSENIDRKSVV